MLDIIFGKIVFVPIFLLVKIFIYKIIVKRFHDKWEKECIALYGKPLVQPYARKNRWWYSIGWGPIKEELIFRGPIWIALKLGISAHILLPAVCVLGIYFGWQHRNNIVYFERGGVFVPKFALIAISISGIIYGLAVLLTGSILVPVLIHSFWNAYVIFSELKKHKGGKID